MAPQTAWGRRIPHLLNALTSFPSSFSVFLLNNAQILTKWIDFLKSLKILFDGKSCRSFFLSPVDELDIKGRPQCHAPPFGFPRASQIRSVAQSCPTLCNPMNRSMAGLPVHHQLPEFTETHIHQVSDAIQPSHPLLSPSPPHSLISIISLSEKCKSKPQWGTISRQSEWLRSKSLQAINAGEGVEKREPSYTVGGNAN